MVAPLADRKKGTYMRNSLKIEGQVKTYLKEDELPKAWYNVRADMKKKPAPLLNLYLCKWCADFPEVQVSE